MARAIDDLTATLAGSRNDPWYRELARQVAECIADLERIRAACHGILKRIGEFEEADAAAHNAVAKLLERIAKGPCAAAQGGARLERGGMRRSRIVRGRLGHFGRTNPSRVGQFAISRSSTASEDEKRSKDRVLWRF